MTFPCYPKYRASGVEWLDQVPDHWSSVPIKYMALERNSLFLDGDWIESKDISSDGIRYITTGNVGEGAYKEQGAGFISEETFHALGCTEVYEGDVLVSRLNNPIGRACVVPDLGGRVVTSVDNVIFRPDSKFDKKFIVYLFSSEEYFKHTSNLARGATMQRISRGLLGNIRVVTPSFEEQTQIARFLDHETARIDALIEEQQRLIELLKEKRQAVISHAVTKGLDPTVPMKDSEISYLDKSPIHWRLKRLGDVVAFAQGKAHEPYIDDDGDFICVNSRFVSTEGKTQKNCSVNLTPASVNDILMVMSDLPNGRALARAYYVIENGRLAVNQRVCRITAEQANSRFLFYLLNRHPGLMQNDDGVNQTHLSNSDFQKLRIFLPSLAEQSKIAHYLDHVTVRIDALISEAVTGVGLLQERRSALISATVTGKIDVRGWEPPASIQAPAPAVAEAV